MAAITSDDFSENLFSHRTDAGKAGSGWYKILKFRSMVMYAEEQFEKLKDFTRWSAVFKIWEDSHMARSGEYIRRISIDEWLFNSGLACYWQVRGYTEIRGG